MNHPGKSNNDSNIYVEVCGRGAENDWEIRTIIYRVNAQ